MKGVRRGRVGLDGGGWDLLARIPTTTAGNHVMQCGARGDNIKKKNLGWSSVSGMRFLFFALMQNHTNKNA